MLVSPDDASFDSVVEVSTGVRWIHDLINACASSTDSLVSGSCIDDIVLFFFLFFFPLFPLFFPHSPLFSSFLTFFLFPFTLSIAGRLSPLSLNAKTEQGGVCRVWGWKVAGGDGSARTLLP